MRRYKYTVIKRYDALWSVRIVGWYRTGTGQNHFDIVSEDVMPMHKQIQQLQWNYYFSHVDKL